MGFSYCFNIYLPVFEESMHKTCAIILLFLMKKNQTLNNCEMQEVRSICKLTSAFIDYAFQFHQQSPHYILFFKAYLLFSILFTHVAPLPYLLNFSKSFLRTTINFSLRRFILFTLTSNSYKNRNEHIFRTFLYQKALNSF